MDFFEILKAILQGIVQGITEWLPISSTGHIILLNEFLPFAVSADPERNKAFFQVFKVLVQLGSIMAVLVLFFHKLNPFSRKKSPLERRDTLLVGQSAHREHPGRNRRRSPQRYHR